MAGRYKDIKPAWPTLSSTLILKKRRKQSCPGNPAAQMLNVIFHRKNQTGRFEDGYTL